MKRSSLTSKEDSLSQLQQAFEKAHHLAQGSRWLRLMKRPYTYLRGMITSKLLYNLRRKPYPVSAKTFYNYALQTELPAGLDIYLTGTKTHPSELKLVSFLLQNLKPGMQAIDVGAHVGFFTCLMGKIVGPTGRIAAFEPTPSTYHCLQANTNEFPWINAYQRIVSDSHRQPLTFYTYPTLQSEYNTLNPQQFAHEKWAQQAIPYAIESVRLDQFCQEYRYAPDLIKIDVEGAESKVLAGIEGYLATHSPTIIMEYVPNSNEEEQYRKAIAWMIKREYQLFQILADGKLRSIVEENPGFTDSENLVFRRQLTI